MKAFVVYESMFGNTGQVARAVASGLEAFLEVQIVDVAHAPTQLPDDIAVIIAGGPTHAFSMTRPNTRADAVRQGARSAEGDGLREWLDSFSSGRHQQKIATFDTRMDKVRHLLGSAAKSAARSARRHGFAAVAPGESFYVSGIEGPLIAGEVERAADWGRQLAASLADA